MRLSLPTVVRAIALFEAAKGIIALLASIGLLTIGGNDVRVFAEQLMRFCHFDPASRYAHVFLEAAGNVSSSDLSLLAAIAIFYAVIRACEAYWLWNGQLWAEWFALGSTCFYLPVEIYELTQHATWFMFGVLLMNVAIVVYLANALRSNTSWSRLWADPKLSPVRAE